MLQPDARYAPHLGWALLAIALGGLILQRRAASPGGARAWAAVSVACALGLGLAALLGPDQHPQTRAGLLGLAMVLGLHGVGSLGTPQADGQPDDSSQSSSPAAGELPLTPVAAAGAVLVTPDLTAAVAGSALVFGWVALRAQGGDGSGRDPKTGAATRGERLPSVPALAVLLVSLGLGVWGDRMRLAAGGTGAVEWLGIPLRGDLSTTALFVSVALPLVMPGLLGGLTAGLAAGPRAGSREGLTHGLGSAVGSLCSLILLQTLFGGVEALRTVGVIMLGMAILAGAGPRRLASRRHAALIQGATGIAVFCAGTGDEAAANGVALLGLSLAAGSAALSVGVVRATHSRALWAPAPGEALVRAMPQTAIFSWVAALAIIGFPATLGGLGSGIGFGSAALDGAGQWADAVLGLVALLAALVLAPLMVDLFHSDPDGEAGPSGGLPRVMGAAPAAGGLGAGFLVSTGLVPGTLLAFWPHPDATMIGYRGGIVVAGLLLVSAAVGVVVHRVLATR